MALQSLYDLLNGENSSGNPDLALNAANPDAVVARQRFVYHFAGKSLDTDIWAAAGTGTTTITSDGLKILSTSDSPNPLNISFGNKRLFSKVGCSMIWSSAQIGAGGSRYEGLINTINTYSTNIAMMFIHGGGANFTTGDGSGTAGTNTYDNNLSGLFPFIFTTYKIEQNKGNSKCFINNKLAATRTGTQPALDLQPFSTRYYSSTGATYVRYVEAWNH